MPMITVKAKVTGFHPVSGQYLVEGETFTIDEQHFGDECFERPDAKWLAPWGQEKQQPPASPSNPAQIEVKTDEA